MSAKLSAERTTMGYNWSGSGGGSAASNLNLVLDCSSATGISYTSSDIEFSEGAAKLKNQFASDIIFAAKLSSSGTATYSKNGGSLTATTTGTVTYSGGKAVFTHASAKYISYDPTLNWVVDNIAAVRFLVTPNYSGSPSATQHFFYTGVSTVGDTGRFDVVHISNGNLALNLHDANGGVSALPFGAWSPTSGVEYEILAEMNYTSGAHRIFVDGTVKGSATGITATRHFGAGIMRLGVDYDETLIANFSIRDLVVYSATQKTAGYTAGYTVPSTKYLTTDPTLKNTTPVIATAYASFTAGTTVAGSDLVKYQIEVGGVAKYWNGSAWATSNGSYAQSSTAADINTNASTLTAGSTRIVAVLHSADGSTTPALASAILVYT